LLLAPDGGRPAMLESDGPLIGAVEGLEFNSGEVGVPAGSRLFIYSDGAFEVSRPDGSMWAFDDFVATLSDESTHSEGRLEGLLSRIREISARNDFQDDFSMLELSFS
jgi:sigma-B regulation protein RsbU (phosphoserine phosphatase)